LCSQSYVIVTRKDINAIRYVWRTKPIEANVAA
jgi:hypothetical protein